MVNALHLATWGNGTQSSHTLGPSEAVHFSCVCFSGIRTPLAIGRHLWESEPDMLISLDAIDNV